jgi:hypothetical protein
MQVAILAGGLCIRTRFVVVDRPKINCMTGGLTGTVEACGYDYR